MKKILLSVFALITLASCQKDADMEVKTKDTPGVVNPSASAENTFISAEEASKIAEKFVVAQKLFGPATKSVSVKYDMAYTDLGNGPATKASSKKPAYYIYNLNEKGYVIVAAHKAANPVLGYSLNGKFDSKNMSDGLVGVLDGFATDINKARELNIKADAKTAAARAEFLTEGALTKADWPSIRPLLGNIQWNQSPYYNALCPARDVPVGCVATAAAQIMRYWKYPKQSRGQHSYYHNKYGRQSFDYNRSWDWSKMPAEPLRRPNQEMAEFNYAVAVSVNMQFDSSRNGGSGAYTDEVPAAMKKYFNYSKDIDYISRKNHRGNWSQILYNELKAGRPIEYCGHGNHGGHAFVCDGYRSNGYFHFNWGWAGSSDGYFLLDALNPGTLGVGGGSGGFNKGQGAVINFAPPAGWNNDGDRRDPINPRVNPNDNDNGRNGGRTNTYCESKAEITKYAYISKVRFGNEEISSGASYNGYEDHTSNVINVNRGRVDFQFTPGYYYHRYKMGWAFWIDANKDGKFSSNEKISETTSSDVVGGSITIGRNLSGKYRVRVSAKEGAIPTACEKFTYGEVEDFTINVR